MNGNRNLQQVWAIFTDEGYLDSIWVSKENAEAYIQEEIKRGSGGSQELHIWETPVNNWGSKFGGVGA